jgi:DNA-binding transcriptional MerR regulator
MQRERRQLELFGADEAGETASPALRTPAPRPSPTRGEAGYETAFAAAEQKRASGRPDRPGAAIHRPPKKLFRVSEIAEHVGVTRQTIHNYATIGLITEQRQTPGGQRLYDESVFPVLARIQRLKARHRLAEIRRLLEEEVAREVGLSPSGERGAGSGGESATRDGPVDATAAGERPPAEP